MLFAFTEQNPVVSVRGLAEALDMPVPSVHRYVALLRDMGLIEEGNRGRYHLTMRVTALARAARQATPIVELAEPHMRRLSEELGEAVLLMRMVRRQPVCFARVEAPTRFRLSFDPGQALPLLRGASVRLLLGSLTPAERRRYVEVALEAGADLPSPDASSYLEQVERDLARGWAVSNEEIDRGVWAASAAVLEDGAVVAALSSPCAAFRLDDAQRDRTINAVRAAADGLTNALSPT